MGVPFNQTTKGVPTKQADPVVGTLKAGHLEGLLGPA